MQAIDDRALADAKRLLAACGVVIDCGFAVGPMNQGNINLLKTAMEKGKPVLSLRQNGAGGRLPFQADGRVVRCDDVAQLMEALDRCFPDMGRRPADFENK